MREAHHLAVLGGEALERGGHLPAEHRLLDRRRVGLLLADRLAQREPWAHRGPPARVDDRVARDLVEPRADAGAVGIVGLAVPPGAQEDLLHDLLGHTAFVERVEREAVELAGVGAVERSQRLSGLVALRRPISCASVVTTVVIRRPLAACSATVDDRARAPGPAHCELSGQGLQVRPQGEGRAARPARRTASAWSPRPRGCRERKCALTRAPTGSERRSSSKRSTSRPSRSARAHRCGSSNRPGSANSASCIGQNAPCRPAASAAQAAAWARGWLVRTGKWRKQTRSARPRSRPRAPRRTGIRSRRRRSTAGARRPADVVLGPGRGSGAEVRSLRRPRRARRRSDWRPEVARRVAS